MRKNAGKMRKMRQKMRFPPAICLKKISGASGAHKTHCSSQLTDYKTMPLECFLLNITLRDLPKKCEKKCGKMRIAYSPPPCNTFWVATIAVFIKNHFVELASQYTILQ